MRPRTGRAEGSSRVVILGQSMGANAALAHAGSGRRSDGVVALAPGHVPEVEAWRSAMGPSLKRAREMIAAGQGEEKAWFLDINQGQRREVRTTARSYLSYFDPEGLGAMPLSAAAIQPARALFMAVGQSDRMAAFAEQNIFARAPAHAKSRYVSMAGDHMNIVRLIADPLVDWLKQL